VKVLFEVTGYGTEITLEQLCEGIEAVISRRELRDAVEAVTGMVPPADADDDGQMRALLAARGCGRTVLGQRRGQRGCGRAAARRADQGHPGTREPDRPAQAGRRDAAAGRPA